MSVWTCWNAYLCPVFNNLTDYLRLRYLSIISSTVYHSMMLLPLWWIVGMWSILQISVELEGVAFGAGASLLVGTCSVQIWYHCGQGDWCSSCFQFLVGFSPDGS